MLKARLTSILTLTAFLLATTPARADALEDSTPDDSLEPGKCYDPQQLKVIAAGLNELGVCKKTLELREQFIAQAKLNPPPEQAWWQDPSVVIGGIVVSASVGLALGVLVGQGRLP